MNYLRAMEFINDIVHIISKRKLQNIDILDKSLIASKDSILTHFYNGIESGSLKNDEESIKYLYDSVTDDNIKKFRQLKSRFKRRLLNTLFFLDVNNKEYETEVQKCYFECVRSLQILNIIQKYGGNQSLVFDVIQDYYQTAQKYEFYDILKEYNFKLITYYSVKANVRKLQECTEKYNKYATYQSEIDQMHILFSKINCLISMPKDTSKEQLDSLLLECEMISQKSEIYLTNAYYLLSKIVILEYKGLTQLLSKTCDEFISFLDTKDNASRQSFKGIASSYKISTLLQFREYEIGIRFIDDNIQNAFGINWFEIMDRKLKFALNSKNSGLSIKIINTVFSHKAFSNLPEIVKEKWYINEGYAIFYSNYVNNGNYKYNIAKLINQVPLYYHDKSGYNFSIIVLQFLFSLAKKDKDNCASIIQSLKVYKTRYFKSDDKNRSIEFISILFLLSKQYFNKNRINYSIIEKYKTSLPEISYIHDHEIITYDLLLSMIEDLL